MDQARNARGTQKNAACDFLAVIKHLVTLLFAACIPAVAYGQIPNENILHLSELLRQSPEAEAAVQEYQQLKAAGMLAQKVPDLSESVRHFKVYNHRTRSIDEIEFTAMGDTLHDPVQSEFRLWVETAMLRRNVITHRHIERMVRTLAYETPARSYDPNRGVMELVRDLFGDSPNVDGDGITDILWLDIQDTYDEETTSGGYVLGFVSLADLTTTVGNGRDCVYIDAYPSIIDFEIEVLESTVAHEFQHLVHWSYDRNEHGLISEGSAQWAEYATGFYPRPIGYFRDPKLYNRPLYEWPGDQIGKNYERARVFAAYFGERFGTKEAAAMIYSPLNETAGLQGALDTIRTGIDFSEFLHDWHVANYVNDASLGPKWGYTQRGLSQLRITPRRVHDGEYTSSMEPVTVSLAPGGVIYEEWRNLQDLTVAVNPERSAGTQSVRATLLLYEEVTHRFKGTMGVPVTGDSVTATGRLSKAVLVIVGLDPRKNWNMVEYGATWSPKGLDDDEVQIVYDSGVAKQGAIVLPRNELQSTVVTRFNPAPSDLTNPDITLTDVWIAPYWMDLWEWPEYEIVIPEGTPRDFEMQVWSSYRNAPDQLIYSRVMEDTSGIMDRGLELKFRHYHLAADSMELSMLPDTMFIGFSDAGSDPNNHYVGAAEYTVEDLSWLRNPDSGLWTRWWDLRASGTNPEVLVGTIVPIRAQFTVREQIVQDIAANDRLADVIQLHANYPNPFTSSTIISYKLPRPSKVKLTVFDLLGREVKVLTDRSQQAGQHRVRFTPAALSSGYYFYRLETDNGTHTQRMLLIK